MTNPPPGWFPDPGGSGQQRYWDGTQWAPATAPPPSAPPGWYPNPSGAPGSAWWSGTEWTIPDAPSTPAEPVAVDKKAAKAAQKAAEKEEKAAQKAAEKEERAASFAQDLAQAGDVVASGTFGGKTIHIYRNGYVRVATFMRDSVKFEKLIAIESSADITKKSGAGRAAGAVFTGGLNLMSSNKRGDVYLTIVTETTAHTLRSAPSMGAPMTAQKLSVAGSAVIGQES